MESLPLLPRDARVEGPQPALDQRALGLSGLPQPPDPRRSRRSWSTVRGLGLRKHLSQHPAGRHQAVIGGPVGTGRGSSVYVGAFPHRGCLWKWFPIIGLCAFVCVIFCGCAGVSDVVRPSGKGLGLVNPCPMATCSSSQASVRFMLGPSAPLAVPGPWAGRLLRAG